MNGSLNKVKDKYSLTTTTKATKKPRCWKPKAGASVSAPTLKH